MESAVISTTRKSEIFFPYSGCLNLLSSKRLPERFQTETSQQIDIRAYWSSTNWQTTVQQLFRSSLNKILAHKQNSWVPTLCNNIYPFFFFFQFMVQLSSQQTKRVQQEHGLTSTHKHPAWPDEKLVMMAWVKSACKRKSFFFVSLFVWCTCRRKYM